MEFRLSEYGKHTSFTTLDEAIDHCTKNNLTDGEHGRLWLIAKNMKEGNAYVKMIRSNSINFIDEYMILSYNRRGNTYIWDMDSNNWYESEMYWEACRRVGEELQKIADSL